MDNNQETETIYAEVVETVDNDFSPLDAPVKQRSYTQHKMDAHQVMPELDEPTFEAPSYTDFDEPTEKEKEPARPFNEAYSELDGKEKTMGAEMMAEMTLDLYEKGCGFLGKVPEISEGKLDRLIAEGEIDADIKLPTENGEIPIKEFAVEYNESIKEAFQVSDEFKEKVKPPLIRVFKKRGVGMTDEQLLAYYFVTDLGTKGVQAFMLKKTANNILDSLKENTLAIRESNAQREKPEKPTPPAPNTTSNPINISTVDSELMNKDNYVEDDYVEVTVMDKPKPKAKAKPTTDMEKQIMNFSEPEEEGVYSILSDKGGFADEYVAPSGMPNFGDKKILAELERLSEEPTKPVRRTRANSGTKKPSTRKPKK
jgi:hypothetical protein